jgi:uncharacterized protein HemX
LEKVKQLFSYKVMLKGFQMKNIFIIVAILAGGYFFWQQKFNDNQTEASAKDDYQRVSSASNISQKTNNKNPNLSKLSVNSKMRLAEKYQKEYERKASALLKEMAADHLTPKKVMKYNSQFGNLGQDKMMKFNSLRMPCPSTVGKSSYSTWSNKYRQKGSKFMDSIIERRNKLTSKVKGYGTVPM